MTADEPYYSTKLGSIPVPDLKDIIKKEIVKLCFDFGQKVLPDDPEITYMVSETAWCLRDYYPKWRLRYVDECFRRGKLDQYDRGQRVTVKRIQTWLKMYNNAIADNVKEPVVEEIVTAEQRQVYADRSAWANSVIEYRQLRKPEFDGDEWTLPKISKTEGFQNWLKRGIRSNGIKYNLIGKKL